MAWKRNIIHLNLILSITFGLLMGCLFPVYAGFFVDFKSPAAKIIFTLGCLVAGLVVGLGAFLITKYTLIKVIRKVNGELQDLQGDEIDLTRRMPPVSSDALGQLPALLNQFLYSMNSLVSLTQNNMGKTSKMTQQLLKNMENTHDSVKKISETVNLLDQSTKLQAKDVNRNEEAWDSMNQIVLNAISHVLELFNQMNTLTKQMLGQSDSVETILERISQVAEVIGGTEDHQNNNLSSFSRNFMALTDRTLEHDLDSFLELDEFIGKIEDISSRTSTLAINASIEAARSGKGGEGFKVIAQEIRKLSTEAESLSNQIRGSIEQSRQDIKDSRGEVHQSRDGVNRFLKSAKGSLEELQSEASSIRSTTESVQQSYNQVSDLLKMIRTSLGSLQESSESSRGIMEDLGKSTGDIRNGMEQISEVSKEIRRMASRTGNQVDMIVLSLDEVNQQLLSIHTDEEAENLEEEEI